MAVYRQNEGADRSARFSTSRGKSTIVRSSTRRLMTNASIALTYAPRQPSTSPNMGAPWAHRECPKEPGDFSAGLLETSR